MVRKSKFSHCNIFSYVEVSFRRETGGLAEDYNLQKYTKEGVTEKCQHSGYCVTILRDSFAGSTKENPWKVQMIFAFRV